MARYFTGVGARYGVPSDVYDRVDSIGRYLIGIGYRNRTGDAVGMDAAWRKVCAHACDFYAPRNRSNPLADAKIITGEHYVRAKNITRQYHPYFHNLGDFEAELHIRNVFEVLGDELNNPSEFLVCWTKDGAEKKTTRETGGTGQAIRLAIAYDIPVFNLYHADAEYRLAKHLKYLNWR